jgi:hypothetical protein
MSALRLPVLMVDNALMVSIHSRVTALMDTLDVYVMLILMNVRHLLVLMVDSALMVSIHSHVTALMDMLGIHVTLT